LALVACGGASPPRAATGAEHSVEPEPPSEAVPEPQPEPELLTYGGGPMLHTPTPFPAIPSHGPWEPDPRLPAVWIRELRTLFEEFGVPDPRGMELRRVTLHLDDVSGLEEGSVETVGFLIPGPAVEGRRFVIGPNGLVYAAEAVGDVVELDDLEDQTLGEHEGLNGSWRGNGMLTSLLARRGDYGPILAAVEVRRHSDRGVDTGNYFTWTWLHVERALSAHTRGDDVLALHDARIAARVLRAHGDELSQFRFASGWLDEIVLPLLHDQERRAAERTAGISSAHVNASTQDDAQAEVRRLIARLDDVGLHRRGLVDYVGPLRDATVQRLVELGEIAAEPLIEVLAHDDRLARHVSYWQVGLRSRSIWPVYHLAYFALVDILHTEFVEPSVARDARTREEMLHSVRAYWQRYGRLSPPERWYALLRTDDAGVASWREAGMTLATPENRRVQTRESMFTATWDAQNLGPRGPMRGESLRDDRAPSVSELLAARMHELMARARTAEPGPDVVPTQSVHEPYRSELTDAACALAGDLVVWDRSASHEPLRQQLAECDALHCRCMWALFWLLGDDEAVMSRYVSWLRGIDPRGVRLFEVLRPLVGRDDDPAVRRAIPRLLRHRRWRRVIRRSGWVRLEVRAVREILLEELRDRDLVGVLTIEAENGPYCRYQHRRDDGSPTQENVPCVEDDPCPPLGTRRQIRRVDELMETLARGLSSRGAPNFRLYWSVSRRNAAISYRARQLMRGET